MADTMADFHEARFVEGMEVEDDPEETAKAFYTMMEAAQKPLQEKTMVSQLDAISRLIVLKSQLGISRDGFDLVLTVLGKLLSDPHTLPKNTYESQRLLRALKMPYEGIQACPKGCVLFRGDHEKATHCPKSKAARFVEVEGSDGKKKQSKIPEMVLRHLPFLQRIQRLYMIEGSAKQMTWHKNGKRYSPDKMVHPADGDAWKHFDDMNPSKAMEARNVRVALATDGFNPFGMMAAPYTCWPVFVIPLNLPPGVMFEPRNVFLTLIIPGHLGNNMGVFMQPVWDELQHAWGEGVKSPAEVLAEIEAPQIDEVNGGFIGYGNNHMWTHISALTRLPYFKHLLLPHNIDVMHTEKNVAEALWATLMDIGKKSKDNVKARLDVEKICDRPKLVMKTPAPGKRWKRGLADYILKRADRKEVLQWMKTLQFPDGYAVNLSRGVNLQTMKVLGMKSHDFHIWIERILPAMTRGYLPEPVWRVLAELSFFFHQLCAKELSQDICVDLEKAAPLLLCKLEMIFPPGFFLSMQHLILHLPREARLGGPVQAR
ncbi:uncharacterized protein [Miscanthus floridulus]|uniref:uncharacterized protein n=1 Tax=Miscanthus floridulus TaxID=154761 RepID=UPI0034574633